MTPPEADGSTADRPYVDTRVLDMAAATEAARQAAETWQLARPELLRHGMNAIFRCDDVVLRVATPTAPASVSIELASELRDAGVPVPTSVTDDVVESRGHSVTAWHFLESTGDPIDWGAVGGIVRRVHDLDRASLPDGLPLPSPAHFPWWNFERMLYDVADELDAPARSGLEASIGRYAGWSDFDDTVVCHGDVHPGNVVMTSSGPVLIDWDLMCDAPRGWDHGPLMTWTERWGGEPGIYEAFAEGYGWSGRGDEHAEAVAQLRLVAATLMRVKAALRDEAARPEAERRLAYWRDDDDAPAWRAQ